MANVLNHLYEELKKLKLYLIKIGSSTRRENILQIKLKEAPVIFNEWVGKFWKRDKWGKN